MMRPASLVLAALLLMPSLPAQTPAESLRGTAQRIGAKQLPDGWRAVSLGSNGMESMMQFGMGMQGAASGNAPENLLLTAMGAFFVDPDQFQSLLDGGIPRLRAYSLDLASMMSAPNEITGEKSNPPAPVFREVWIEKGRITTWSPIPELTKEALMKAFPDTGSPAGIEAKATAALQNVKQLSIGALMYTSDYDDLFPYAQSTGQAKTNIMPYLKNSTVWQTENPRGGRILYNTALSGVSATTIESPAATILFWEEFGWADGKRAVGYTDGHVKRVTEAEWQKIWQAELRRRTQAKGRSAQIVIK